MKVLVYFLFFIGVPVIVLLFIGSIRSWQVETDPRQKLFLKGKIPEKMPEGYYKGKAEGRRIDAWRGKDFNAQTMHGVNIISKDEKRDYPFMFYTAKGLQDKNKDVLVLDYKREDNPWWIHFFTDEIVQTDENKFLGKLHLVIPPHMVFSLGYFTLTK